MINTVSPQCDIECNGLVPREEYTLSTEEVLSHEDAMQSLYKNVTLKKGEMHEVLVIEFAKLGFAKLA